MSADAVIVGSARSADAAVAASRSSRALLGWLWSAGLMVVLAFLVIYPVMMLLLGALTNTNPVVDGFGVFNLSLKQLR